MTYICNYCNKVYTNKDKFYKHINRHETGKRGIEDDYKYHIRELKSYYNNTIKQNNEEYKTEITKLDNEILFLKQSLKEQEEELNLKFKKNKQELRNEIINLNKDKNSLLDKLRTINITQVLDDNMKSQYTKDLANKNVEITKLKQEMEIKENKYKVELRNNQLNWEKKINEHIQSHSVDLDKLKTEYESKLDISTHKLKQMEEVYESKLKTVEHNFKTKYNTFFIETKDKFTEEIKGQNIKIKQLEHEKEIIKTDSLEKYKNIKHDLDHAINKLKITTQSIEELKKNHANEITKITQTKKYELEQLEIKIYRSESNLDVYKKENNTLKNKIKTLIEEQKETEKQHGIEQVNQKQLVNKLKDNLVILNKKYEEKENKVINLLFNEKQKDKQIKDLKEKYQEIDELNNKFNESIKIRDGFKKNIETLNEKIREYDHKLDRKNMENKRFEREKEDLNLILNKIKEKLIDITTQYTLDKITFKNNITTLEEQKKEIKILNEKYRDIQDKYHNILTNTKSTLKEEKDIINHLRYELEKAISQIRDQDELMKNCRDMDITLTNTKTKLISLNGELNSKNSELSRLRDELKLYKDKNNQYDKDFFETRDTLRNYEDKISYFRKETDKYKEQKHDIERQFNIQKTKYSQLTNQCIDLESKLTIYNKDNSRLKSEISTLTENRDILGKNYGELKVVNDSIAKTLNKVKGDFDERTKEYELLTEKYTKTVKDLVEFKNQHKLLYKQCEEQKKLSEVVHSQQKTINKLKGQLQEQLKLESNIKELEDNLYSSKHKIKNLEVALSNLNINKNNLIHEYQCKILNYEKEIENNKTSLTKINHLEKEIKSKVNKEKDINKIIKEKIKVEDELNTTILKLKDIEVSRDKYKNMYQKMGKNYDELKTDYSKLVRIEDINKDLRKQLQELENKQNTCQEQNNNLRMILDKYKQKLNQNNQEILTLNKAINEKNLQEDELHKIFISLQNEFNEYKQTTILTNNKYKYDHEKLKQTLDKKQLQIMNENNKQIENLKQNLNDQELTLKKSIKNYQKRYEELREKNVSIDTELNSERLKNAELNELICNLKIQLKKITNKSDEFKHAQKQRVNQIEDNKNKLLKNLELKDVEMKELDGLFNSLKYEFDEYKKLSFNKIKEYKDNYDLVVNKLTVNEKKLNSIQTEFNNNLPVLTNELNTTKSNLNQLQIIYDVLKKKYTDQEIEFKKNQTINNNKYETMIETLKQEHLKITCKLKNTISLLTTKITDSEQIIKNIQKTLSDTKINLNVTLQKHGDIQDKYKLIKQELERNSIQNKSHIEHNDTLQKQIKHLKEKLDVLTSERDKQAQKITQNNICIIEQKKELEIKNILINELNNKYSSLSKEFDDYKQKITIKFNEYKTANSSIEKELSLNKEKYQHTETELKEEFRILLNKSKDILNKTIIKLKYKLKVSIKQNEKECKLNQELKEKLSYLENNIQTQKLDIEKSTKLFNRTEHTNNIIINDLKIKLKEQNDEFQLEINNMKIKEQEMEDIMSQNNKLQISIKHIENKCVQLEQELDKNKDIQDKLNISIDSLEKKNQELKKKLEESISEIILVTKLKVKLASKIDILNLKLTHDEKIFKELESRLNSEIIKYKEEIKVLKEYCNDLNEQNKKLNNTLNSYPTFEQLNKDKKIKENTLNENKILEKKLEYQQKQIQDFDMDKDKMKDKLKNFKQDLINTNREKEKLKNNIELLKNKIKEYIKTIDTLNKEVNINKSIQDTIEQKELEIDTLQKQLKNESERSKKLGEDCLTSVQKLMTFQHENSDLNKQNKTLLLKIDDLNQAIDNIKYECLTNLNKQNKIQGIEMQKLSEMIEMKEKRIKELEESLSIFIKRLDQNKN